MYIYNIYLLFSLIIFVSFAPLVSVPNITRLNINLTLYRDTKTILITK